MFCFSLKERKRIGEMGKGKGRRRREANYRAAHDGDFVLPAPPQPADFNTLPSKLRRIMSLKVSSSPSSRTTDNPSCQSKNNSGIIKPKLQQSQKNIITDKKTLLSTFKKEKHEANDLEEASVGDALSEEQSSSTTKKRKRNESLQDLMDRYKIVPIRKGLNERKKRYLQEKKKKKKKKSAHFSSTESRSLHHEDKVNFGEVVDAPPKLLLSSKQTNVSQERLRLQAIESYRQKKKWVLRPGSHKPPLLTPVTTLN